MREQFLACHILVYSDRDYNIYLNSNYGRLRTDLSITENYLRS